MRRRRTAIAQVAYRVDRSYAWNYSHAPTLPRVRRLPPGPGGRLFDRALNSRLGIASGPLLNAKWVEGYARFAALVRAGALVLGIVLGVAALMIVANTIRLAVYAREDEIEILALVGASRSFIRIPFLVEGTLQGALGGSLAVGLLYLGYLLLVPRLEYGLELLLGNTSPHFFSPGGA